MVLHPVEELLPGRKHVGTGRPLAKGVHRRLRGQICRSTSRRWIQRETCSSLWEGLQREVHNASRCSAIYVSWYAVRLPWDSIPRQWRGADQSRSWFLSEKVFDSNRSWLQRQHPCQPGVGFRQVARLPQWVRLQNSFSPSGETPSQVYKELFQRNRAVSWKLPQKRLL